MPTARELLEQADALMRRNRNAAPAEQAKPAAPAAHASIAQGLVSPRTIQREPIAPSLARTSLPVDPLEAAEHAHEGETPAAPDDAAGNDSDLPLLTEAVDEAAVPDLGDLDDVPVLTDIVEEIEMTVAGPLEQEESAGAVVDEDARGEPSLWLDDDAEPSVLGLGPDSIGIVPPAAGPGVPATPPQGRDPLGFDQPPPGFVPAAQARAERFVEPPAEASAPDEMPAPPVADHRPVAAALSPEEDEARVRAIAEEIGMQVLQRIDIFTDTTLRERLGEHLQPVVERISAELVDALNQHVGELLRAHVAEAIEREIESWRGQAKR
ncbi:MAG: hypothetical protein IT517_02795 [Burkholderiales bacterium]|nr:hypothetical protein [Burkholderiales bacterium]